ALATALLACFFHDSAPTQLYPLSLHDALPICGGARKNGRAHGTPRPPRLATACWPGFSEVDLRAIPAAVRPPARRCCRDARSCRSEEHTSELQSPCNLVCRLLLEKKKYFTMSL